MLHVKGNILEVSRVLLNHFLGDRHDRRVNAQLAIGAQHPGAPLPNRLHVSKIVLVGGAVMTKSIQPSGNRQRTSAACPVNNRSAISAMLRPDIERHFSSLPAAI